MRLALIVHHLLKWQYQPERQSRDWRNTITQRTDLSYVIKDSPSLRQFQSEILPDSYARSRREALRDTGVYHMPETCPWTIEQVLDDDFLQA